MLGLLWAGRIDWLRSSYAVTPMFTGAPPTEALPVLARDVQLVAWAAAKRWAWLCSVALIQFRNALTDSCRRATSISASSNTFSALGRSTATVTNSMFSWE